MERDEGCDRRARTARDRRDRPLGSDARPRRSRCSGAGRPARDPLERPADIRRVRRDRGAHRARSADRPHGKPGADGLHRTEASLAPPPRAGGVRADRADHAAEGLRTAATHGRVGDGRRRRVGHAPARRRPPPLVDRGARAPSTSIPRSCRRSSNRPRSPAPLSPATICHQGFRLRRVRGTARRRRSGWGSTGRGRSRS